MFGLNDQEVVWNLNSLPFGFRHSLDFGCSVFTVTLFQNRSIFSGSDVLGGGRPVRRGLEDGTHLCNCSRWRCKGTKDWNGKKTFFKFSPIWMVTTSIKIIFTHMYTKCLKSELLKVWISDKFGFQTTRPFSKIFKTVLLCLANALFDFNTVEYFFSLIFTCHYNLSYSRLSGTTQRRPWKWPSSLTTLAWTFSRAWSFRYKRSPKSWTLKILIHPKIMIFR